MWCILNHLYHGNLNEAERRVEKLHNTEEYKKSIEFGDKLLASLSKEQKELFNKYFEWDSAYRGLENERLYINGFKTGMQMALETFQFDPPWWKE